MSNVQQPPRDLSEIGPYLQSICPSPRGMGVGRWQRGMVVLRAFSDIVRFP